MIDREKLIALIQAAVNGCSTYWAGLIADHLLANGVTFATDNNVGGKWIPVTERLPEGNVLACFNDGGISSQVCTGCLKEDRWFLTVRRFGDVSHWMPLPEPPTDMRKESKA